MRKRSIFEGDEFISKKGDVCRVVNYVSSLKVEVEFYEYVKTRRFCRAGDLRRGDFKDPFKPRVFGLGYLGDGDIPAWENGRPTTAYQIWSGAMTRCYSKSNVQKGRAKSYRDCTVSEEWHCFATFAKWFAENKGYREGYSLDKDLLVKGNKVYSADTCCFLPKELNLLISVLRGENILGLIGVSKAYNGKYVASVRMDGTTKKLKIRDNLLEAGNDYIEAKEAFVKEQAILWKDKIGEKEFKALMNWRVYE